MSAQWKAEKRVSPEQDSAGPVLCHNVWCKIVGHKPHHFPHPKVYGKFTFSEGGVYVCLRTMRRIRNG